MKPKILKNNQKPYLPTTYLVSDILYTCLRTPSYSLREDLLKYYVKSLCERHDIICEEDTYGNLFITKGEIGENEFYPCVTSHLDTVQYLPFMKEKMSFLDIQCEVDGNGLHILYSNDGGIGADDKAGVAICLSLALKLDKIKVFLPIREELGCWGSYSAFKGDMASWFDNVGYVIGFDSPEYNRAAWCSHGTMLFDMDFFVNHIKDVCDKNGVTKFRSEPYTDVKAIRENTNLVCMNFGNGGYLAHCLNEYLILEDTDKATKLGMDLIESLGYSQYKIEHKPKIDKTTKNFFKTLLEMCEKVAPPMDYGEGIGDDMTTLQLIKEKVNLKCRKLGIEPMEMLSCFNWDVSDGSEYFKDEEKETNEDSSQGDEKKEEEITE